MVYLHRRMVVTGRVRNEGFQSVPLLENFQVQVGIKVHYLNQRNYANQSLSEVRPVSLGCRKEAAAMSSAQQST
jgi:hypothetical protein